MTALTTIGSVPVSAGLEMKAKAQSQKLFVLSIRRVSPFHINICTGVIFKRDDYFYKNMDHYFIYILLVF